MAQSGQCRTLDGMDTIADLLAKRKPNEPPEIRAIKNYVQEQFKETVGVMVRERDIVITVRSSALAGALRMHSVALGNAIGDTSRQFVYRIGQV
jgi:hypothetical protein